MNTQRTFRLPPQVIALDLVGTLLVLLGAFDLAGAPLLGPLSEAASGKGMLLVATGGALMVAGAALLVTRLLAARKAQAGSHTRARTIHMVERRPR